MYLILLVLHSLLRWLVLVFGLLAVFRALAGLYGRRPWSSLDDRAGRYYVVGFDIQTLVGLILYGVLSPITRSAFSDMGVAMRDATLRFYAVEHLTLMLLALGLAHVGLKRARRAATPIAKHRTALIFYGLSLLLLFLGTPWPFRAVGRPLWPF